jgi:hypothetical protein
VRTAAGFAFGAAEPTRMAAFLRELADRIENRDVVIQDAAERRSLRTDDFALTELTLSYCEKEPS